MSFGEEYPTHRTILNARVQAFHMSGSAPKTSFNGGVVLGESASDNKLRQTRNRKPADRFRLNANYTNVLPGEYVYFGPICCVYNYVMTEMIHRVVPSIALFGRKKFLMVDMNRTSPTKKIEDLPAFMLQMLIFFDIPKESVEIISDDAIVSSLSICEQGSDLGGGPKEGYFRFLEDFTPSRLNLLCGTSVPHAKVYVSLRHSRCGGNILGEEYIEVVLKRAGFYIFFPEQHSIFYQMHVYRSAELLILPDGQACCGAELLGRGAINTCILLKRREVRTAGDYSNFLWERCLNLYTYDDLLEVPPVAPPALSGDLLDNRDLSFLDVDTFRWFLRTHGVNDLPSMSGREYYFYAAKDLRERREMEMAESGEVVPDDVFQRILQVVWFRCGAEYI